MDIQELKRRRITLQHQLNQVNDDLREQEVTPKIEWLIARIPKIADSNLLQRLIDLVEREIREDY